MFWLRYGLILLTVQGRGEAQVAASPYKLTLPADEVSLDFHAADAEGLSVNDLRLEDLSLLDNGRPPRKMLTLEVLQNFPIRAGILMDTSQSAQENRSTDRAIAVEYAQHLLRQSTDRAFVMNFDGTPRMGQAWTSDPGLLIDGIRNRAAHTDGNSRFRGTAVFDAIYGACLNEFGHIDNEASSNFILLFSDGEDNASQSSLNEAVAMCQRSKTAIYVFRPEAKGGFSNGPQALIELAAESGGRVFYDNGSDAETLVDLRAIEADLRNQYRLVYRPLDLKRDGSFHRIDLKATERVREIRVRSGYYAPSR